MNKERLDALIEMVGKFGTGDRAVIAGGAVRDAYLGVKARDIDIVLTRTDSVDEDISLIEAAIGQKLTGVERESIEYEQVFSLFRNDDETVEVIIPDGEADALEYVAEFHDDLSRMWVDAYGFHAYTEALHAAARKVITCSSCSEKRIAKLTAKFPHFKVVTA